MSEKLTQKDDCIDWGLVKAEYVNDRKTTLKELAIKYSINENTIRSRSTKENWTVERNKAANDFSQQAIKENARRMAKAALAFNTKCLEASNKLIDLVHEKIDSSKQAGEVIEPNELGHLARAAKSAQEAGRLALGLSTDNKDVSVSKPSDEEVGIDQVEAELLALMGEEAFAAWKQQQ